MSAAGAARVLRQAEERLRARGLTGGRAFEVLLQAVQGHLDGGDHPEAALVEGLPTSGVDLLGLAYERFFTDLFKGRRGQFFTPRPLVQLVLARSGVGPGDTVLDPTCGSGGFLVEAVRRGASVRGIELDPLLADLARLNLRLAGHPGDVRHGDFFLADPEPVDVVVANPPFSVEIVDRAVLERFDLGRDRDRVLSDHLFVEALEPWVKPGGRAGLVLPWTVLDNPSTAPLRARLDAHWRVEAICGLPEGVFRPFGGAAGRACLLWLRRRPCAPVQARWAQLADPGYDVRTNQIRPTSDAEVVALERGEGWRDLSGWLPEPVALGVPSRALAELVTERTDRRRAPKGPVGSVELADADKETGEVRVRVVEGLKGQRAVLHDGDVLVARMRPSLGNVAVVYRPDDLDGPLLGSPEWIVLKAKEVPHFLLHALRSPAWRGALPVTGGQTRPRTSAAAVLASAIPWPGAETAARVDALSRKLMAERAALGARLESLQRWVDDFSAGNCTAADLDDALTKLE